MTAVSRSRGTTSIPADSSSFLTNAVVSEFLESELRVFMNAVPCLDHKLLHFVTSFGPDLLLKKTVLLLQRAWCISLKII